MLKHGSYSLKTDNRLIILKVYGRHNEHDVKATTEALRAAIIKLDGAPFAELIDGSELLGTTPEGYEVLNEYEQWLWTQGCVAKAFVMPNQIIAMIAEKYIKGLRGKNVRNFTKLSEAKAWLHSELSLYETDGTSRIPNTK